jgi:hypothetical protein
MSGFLYQNRPLEPRGKDVDWLSDEAMLRLVLDFFSVMQVEAMLRLVLNYFSVVQAEACVKMKGTEKFFDECDV